MERLQDTQPYVRPSHFETVGEYLPAHLQQQLHETQLHMPATAAVYRQPTVPEQVADTEARRTAGSMVAAGLGDIAVRATTRLGDGTADYAVSFVGAFIGNPDLRIPPSHPVVPAAGRYALAA